jgi:TolB-like protein
VLPFENLSEDKANAYFADGIQDEIFTRLSKIADLKVISRCSCPGLEEIKSMAKTYRYLHSTSAPFAFRAKHLPDRIPSSWTT